MLRRALRVTIFAPPVFPFCGSVLVRPAMAIFSSFGVFCLMARTALGGPIRKRCVGCIVLPAMDIGLIVLATLLSEWIVAAAIGMAVVAFLVRFAGLFGGYALVA